MNTFNLQHVGAINFDNILNTATKVGTSVATVKNAFTAPKVTKPINTTAINQAQVGPVAPVVEGPNYLKIGLIVLAVGVAGVVGYKALN